MLKTLVHVIFGVLCVASSAQAIELQQVPEPLKPWVGWALHGEKEAGCPFLYNESDHRQCAWGAALELKLNETGGAFSQSWQLQRPDWVALPGDEDAWPQSVRLDGKPVAVVDHDGHASVRMDAGRHQLTGVFDWKHLPEAIVLSPETGIVELTLKGQTVSAPYLDEQNQLWLQRRAEVAQAEDHLDLRVHRLLDDDIPLTLATRIQLSVSGKAREVVLPTLLLDGFIPLALQSPLPARLEADGKLRVQARSGAWEITLVARHDGPIAALAMPAGKEALASEEVWAFNAHHPLRLVNVEGVPALDPQQTTLPEDWKRFPAYRIRPGDTLKLIEKKRGDPDPAPDQLNLQRTLWLDFNGDGYTARDQISGAINRSWRLDMAAPAQLGRVAVDGQDQMITQGQAGAAGVELRHGRANIVAESRMPNAGITLPAVGWAQDFQNVATELRLPPGWKLFAATGVDQAPGTWVRVWNLLDIFLVLVVAFAAAKLWGRGWGGVALVTMVLVYPESGAPQWVWLNLLAAAALIRYLPGGMALRFVTVYRGLAFIGLLLIALPFAVQQVRVGLFPALERPWGGVMPVQMQAQYEEAAPVAAPMAGPAVETEADLAKPAAPAAEAVADAELKAGSGVGISASVQGRVASSVVPMPARKMAPSNPMRNLAEHDPNARIQTGPGLPEWAWSSYRLSWSGPVRHSQTMQLWMLSPGMNLLLAFVRVILLAVLSWRMLDMPLPKVPLVRFRATAMAVMLILMGAGIPVDRTWADVPPSDMLETLKQRLTEPPECLPDCVSSPRMQVEINGGRLVLRQEIHTLADAAVPLPGGNKHWLPQRVVVDGEADAGLRKQDDVLWLHLAKGSHQVLMEGALGERDSVEIPLPLRPYQVTSSLSGWSLEGVSEEGRPDDNLSLKRTRTITGQSPAQNTEVLPSFVRINRTLHFGLKWRVETQVTRLSPTGASTVLEVPLLPGESVLTAGLRTQDGKIKVSMAPGAAEMSWSSELKEASAIVLQAAQQNQWAETWQIDASPLWHVEFSGIPPIGHQDAGGMRLPTFRPWPGEELKLVLSRPQAIAGQTLTVDSSQLSVKPGIRDTDSTLELRLRSSQGGQHTVTLPAGAELLMVHINGQEQPIRAQNGKVVLPIVPGAQTFALAFRTPNGMALRTTTPALDIGVASVNTRITVEPPQDRWVLFLGGPRLGPAVLFWGMLLVLAAVAWGLGKVPLTPLKMHEWLLLGMGLTQTPPETGLVIVGWLLVLGWRGQTSAGWKNNHFNFMQLILAFWTLAALSSLFYAIQHGLLGLPEMQIEGNGSSTYSLQWFQDRSAALLPQAWLISVPLWLYRFLMLVWALWLAAALMRWLRWGWGCYTEGGLWRKLVLSKVRSGGPGNVAEKKPDGQA